MSSITAKPPSLFINIRRAFRLNIVPAIFLQILALFVGISYFYWPAAQEVFLYFAALKAEYGMFYAMFSTAFFGGLIPYLYLLLSNKIAHNPVKQLVFYCVIWAFLGVLVNTFYELQGQWYGEGNDLATIVKKTATDLLGYSVFVSSPFMTIMYLWKDCEFSWRKTRYNINRTLLCIKMPTAIITNWIIWLPAVMVIYMMPSDLQVPLYSLVLCLFVLIFAMLNSPEQPAENPIIK